MFTGDEFQIDGIEFFVMNEENNYLLTFRTPDFNYHTCIKIIYHPNGRNFNQTEVELVKLFIIQRKKFESGLLFKNIEEVINYINSILN